MALRIPGMIVHGVLGRVTIGKSLKGHLLRVERLLRSQRMMHQLGLRPSCGEGTRWTS